MQCKDIPDIPILEFLLKNKGHWCNWYFEDQYNVRQAMPKNIPHEKLILSKMRRLIKRGLVDGCNCGCRGDFEITEKGEQYLLSQKQKSKMINLRRNWYVENYEETHPPKHYGIEFDLAVPQTLGDQSWYFNCRNIPDTLPKGYSILHGDLESKIGWGVSKEEVEMLKRNFANQNKQETAVSWFANQLMQSRENGWISDEKFSELLKEANNKFEMQIENSYNDGQNNPYEYSEDNEVNWYDGKRYYNITFKSE